MFNVIRSSTDKGVNRHPRHRLPSGLLVKLIPLAHIATQLFQIGAHRAAHHADHLSHHGLPDLAQRMRAWGKEAIALSAAVTAAARAKGRVS